MKKILILLIVFTFASSAFSLDIKYQSFGFHFTVPVIFENAQENNVKAETNMTSVAFGIHALSLYTEKIGLYSNLDIVIPQTITSEITKGNKTYTYNLSRSDYNSLWGLSALFAPAFSIVHTEKILFTICPGLHYTMLSADSETSALTYLVGIGANIQDSIFFFGSDGYFTFGADIAFDFLGATISNGSSKSGQTHDFIFAPRIGVGLRFK